MAETAADADNSERQKLISPKDTACYFTTILQASDTSGSDVETLTRGRHEEQGNPTMAQQGAVRVGALAILMLIVALTGFVVVPPGELAVIVTLGRVDVYEPGPHLRIPLVSTVHSMSTKTQLFSEQNNIPTKEGLTVSLDVAVLYRIDPKQAGDLYTNVGVDYRAVLIQPEAASVIRGLTSESDAKALYSSGRHKIEDGVMEELGESLIQKGIIIERVMLKEMKLPDSLSKSIELKAQAEQESARMEFVLAREKQEAERKAIEAKGVADFQRIVSEGISEQTLMWKGIEATEELVNSPNSKIIVVGNSKGDLPVIFSA